MPEEWGERERRFLLTVFKLFLGLSVTGLVLYLSLEFFTAGVATVLTAVTFFVVVRDWALRGTPFDVFGGTSVQPRHMGWRDRARFGIGLTCVTSTLLAFQTSGTARTTVIVLAVATGAVTAADLVRRRRA